MIDNNKTNSKSSSRVGRYISSLLSLRSLLTRGAAFALLAGIGTSCSQSMDEEAMTRIGAPMTVTATMQGVGKPAAAVSEVVSGSGTGLPATRTTTSDVATGGIYTAAWQKGDVVNVTFHCYSDAGGTTEIAASQMASGNTQTLTYDGTTWTATPASLRLPGGTYTVKAVYAYSRTYTAADDTPVDATTTSMLINRGTEQIAGQSSVVVPDDITKTGIAIAPAADKWQRQTALIRLTSLAFGQSATVTTGAGTATNVSCPTVQTADPTQPANAILTSTVYLHQPVDNPANTAAVTTVTLDGVSGVVKPAFHTEAGRLYSIYAPVLLGQQGTGGEDSGQTWKGTFAQFYNSGAGAANINECSSWIIDPSTVSEGDMAAAVGFIKNKANARTSTVNITLNGIESLPNDAFNGCTNLAGISLPVATNIGSSAFAYCTALTSVNLPVATNIGSSAFLSCSSLTRVNLPVATSIGELAFGFCSSLTGVNLPVATIIGGYAFFKCSSLTGVDLLMATNVGVNAFYECSSLTSVNLPMVTSIGDCAFYECSSLTDVNLPVATNIGFNAFNACSSLASVYLPMVTFIDGNAFYECSSLTSVNLPVVTIIKDNAFFNVPLITLKLTAAGEMTIASSAFVYSSDNCTLYLNTGKHDGSVLPQVEADGLTWGGVTWKAIQYQ